LAGISAALPISITTIPVEVVIQCARDLAIPGASGAPSALQQPNAYVTAVWPAPPPNVTITTAPVPNSPNPSWGHRYTIHCPVWPAYWARVSGRSSLGSAMEAVPAPVPAVMEFTVRHKAAMPSVRTFVGSADIATPTMAVEVAAPLLTHSAALAPVRTHLLVTHLISSHRQLLSYECRWGQYWPACEQSARQLWLPIQRQRLHLRRLLWHRRCCLLLHRRPQTLSLVLHECH
jgi:hypothetical protein